MIGEHPFSELRCTVNPRISAPPPPPPISQNLKLAPSLPPISAPLICPHYSGSVGEPESERASRLGVMVPGVPCVDRGNRGRELALCDCSVLRRTFWQESRLNTLMSQRCRSFLERVGLRMILLESQPGKQSSLSKRSREIM